MQAIEQSPLVSRAHAATVCGVPTRFVLTAYSNRTFVIVTQTEHMGTLVLSVHAAHGTRTLRQALARAQWPLHVSPHVVLPSLRHSLTPD